MLLLGPSPAAGNETVAAPPKLTKADGSLNIELLSDAAGWFSQSFGFRRELITADSYIKAGLLHTSSQSLVALGRDGWLYYAETLDDFTGADKISPREAYCIARSLRLAQDYAESQGAKFLFNIAPNKAGIYPQYLPKSLKASPEEYASPVIEAMERQGVSYADLFGPLRAQEEQLYFAVDSHWTNRGAALAHDVLLEAFGLPEEDAFSKPGSYGPTHRGDLYEMLYPASPDLDMEYAFAEPLNFSYARPIRDVDDMRIETSSPSPNGPLLMFRDSFGNALHSLMAESFSSAVFSRAMPYNLELIGQSGAEYAALEIVERNLPRLAEAPFIMPAPGIDDWQAVLGGGFFTEDNRCPEDADIITEQTGTYLKVTGDTPAECDSNSPVYLACAAGDGSVTMWEAFPVYSAGTSCTAYLPTDAAGEGAIHMVFQTDGQWKWAAQITK